MARMFRKLLIPVTIAAFFSTPFNHQAATAGPIIFEQQHASLAEDSGGGQFSALSPQQLADDFVLGMSATVTDVHWFGVYLVTPPTVPGFRIRFFTDDGGRPGTTPFYETDVVATFMDTGLVTDFNHLGTQRNEPILEFWADPIPPVEIPGGETIWISILEEPRTTGQWMWRSASAANGIFAFRFLSNGQEWRTSTGDLAFSLSGQTQPVPEPSSLALLGIGIAGLFGYGWRQRRTAA